MRDIVLDSFLESRDGCSPDVVIADPDLNQKFIAACLRRGAVEAPFELNHCLYNLRKRRALEEYPTARRRKLKNQNGYRFAVEIAARFLELRERTTLDRIICHPTLAEEFDRLAQQLAPGHSSFEYRFTALSLRKVRRLQPEIAARAIPANRVDVFRVADLDINAIPRCQGIYIFFFKNAGVLYLGEAKVLRERIRKHLDHSDRKDLARWLWDQGSDDLYVEIHTLPNETTAIQRRALEMELIRSRKPRFNILGTQSEGE